jgi:hypothetical protein
MLAQYLFFLTRRPISKSNLHYLESRLRGLKSLEGALDVDGASGLHEIVAQLRALHPAGFNRRGANLQFALWPIVEAQRDLPADLVIEDGPPPGAGDWVRDRRRALLVFGPGIGIGDELILAPLAKWLKQVNGALAVDALSSYGGIWQRVRDVRAASTYKEHRTLLAALRGEPPYDGYDLVVFADFEAPELYRGVAAEGRLGRYLELSLGSRSGFLVDNERRWLYRLHHHLPYGENFYDGLGQLLRRLGLPVRDRDRFDGVMAAAARPPADRLQAFVTPFTSKYDPSQAYWSHLLAHLAAGPRRRPLRLVLDSGKNAATEAFAHALARSAAARVGPEVSIDVASSDGGPNLSLAGVLEQIEASHVLVCADSFASHAAPLLGRASFVVARAGVEAWHVPHPLSFYFEGDRPADEVGGEMRALLGLLESPPTRAERLARVTQAEARIDELARELEAALDGEGDASVERLRALWDELVPLRRALDEAGAPAGDAAAGARFRDRLPPPPEWRWPAEGAGPLLLHLRDQVERWRNTNYVKHLRLCLGAQEQAAQEPRSLRA